MATNKSVKPTPAGSYPLGHAKEAKDASTWTYKFPQRRYLHRVIDALFSLHNKGINLGSNIDSACVTGSRNRYKRIRK